MRETKTSSQGTSECQTSGARGGVGFGRVWIVMRAALLLTVLWIPTTWAQFGLPKTPLDSDELVPSASPSRNSSQRSPSPMPSQRLLSRPSTPSPGRGMLSSEFRWMQTAWIPDFRPSFESPGDIQVSNSQFQFQIASDPSVLQVEIPLRSLKTRGGAVEASQSEFGGVALRGFWSSPWGLRLGLGYSEDRSPDLNVLGAHASYGGRVDLELEGKISSQWSGAFRFGPEMMWALPRSGAILEYGPKATLFLEGSVAFESGLGELSLGMSAGLHRRLETFAAGIPQGQTALLGYETRAGWQMTESLQIAILYQGASRRPQGREDLLGVSAAPGLYGTSWGVALNARL